MINKPITPTQNTFVKVSINAPTKAGIYKVNVRDTNIGGSILQTHYIIVEESCIDDIQIKWLSKTDGFYKFGTFCKYSKMQRKTKDGLIIPNYFTALSDADARNNVTTKTLQKSITLHKSNMTTQALEYYLDLASSPKVYMYLGAIYDKWVVCGAKWSPSYNAKNNFHKISVVFTLPESYIQVI